MDTEDKTETKRITDLMALHRRTAQAAENGGNTKQVHDDLRHATTLERFALPLAQEVDDLRRVLAGETGDEATVGHGWVCDRVGDWSHPMRGLHVERVRNHPPTWRAFYNGRWTDHNTAVAGMDAAISATGHRSEAPDGY